MDVGSINYNEEFGDKMIKGLNCRDILQIDMDKAFFHYTNINNLDTIVRDGLEPRIGKNSLYVEKSKKVFFAQGQKGILTIMDVWLRWLTSKSGLSNRFYGLGTFYMRMPFCINAIPNYIVNNSLKNKQKRIKVFKQFKNILDNSIFLILDLEENIDFSYDDIDEVKDTYYESFLRMLYPSTSDIKDKRMEYWNMHTYSNRVIDSSKISLFKDGDDYLVSVILKKLIENNIEYVKFNCDFLYEYYNYFYN